MIGITTYGRLAALPFSLPSEYINAVRKAGGIPTLLPPGEIDPALVLDSLDELILSGGEDINPVCYNGFAHPTIYFMNAERDAFELQLAKFALERHLPIFGICRRFTNSYRHLWGYFNSSHSKCLCYIYTGATRKSEIKV